MNGYAVFILIMAYVGAAWTGSTVATWLLKLSKPTRPGCSCERNK